MDINLMLYDMTLPNIEIRKIKIRIFFFFLNGWYNNLMMVTSNVCEMDYIHTLDTHSLDTHKTCIQKQEHLARVAFIFINDLEKGQGY